MPSSKRFSQSSPNLARRSAWSLSQLEQRLMLAADAGVAAEVAATNAVIESQSTEIAFVDPTVEGSDDLLSLVRRGVEVVLMDPSQDVIGQMHMVLSQRGGVSSVHIISHGRSGAIQVADQTIGTPELLEHQDKIRSWKSSLAPGADVLIYGCDVASNAAGQAFLSTWAQLTGADVAGSTDRTGNAALGGDWDLESIHGSVETPLLAVASGLSNVDIVLPITVRAAGQTNEENLELLIDGNVVQTWNNIGGNAQSRQFVDYTYSGGAGVTADRVRVRFTNDLYQPSQGVDRNVRVDNITVNGVTVESEDSNVFSTGTWLASDGVQPGFRQSEWLHTNGYFEYYNPGGTGSTITIYAAGSENNETMELRLNGSTVQTWNNVGGNASSRQFVPYVFNASTAVNPGDIQIHFTNSNYVAGVQDNNLRIDRIDIDGVNYEAEAPSVFSTGTWLPGIGITPGFKQSEWLHANGFFEFASSSNPGSISLETSQITVDENAGSIEVRVIRSNGSDGTVSIDYDTQASSAAAGQDYSTVSGTLTFADGQTVGVIQIPIINDSAVEGLEQFNVTIDNITGGATLLVPRTATVSIVDDDGAPLPDFQDFSSISGINLNGDAVQSGNRIQLTAPTESQAGSAFFTSKVNLSGDASFRSAFSFQLSGGSGTNGGDGITFTIQNDSAGANAIGGSGSSLGYLGIDNSVAVEFDNYQNGGDTNSNHVSIISGSIFNAIETAVPNFDLNNGDRYYAWVDYNGTSNVLAVYLSDDVFKPAFALLKTTIDLPSVVGADAYFGFTGSTGGVKNLQEIYSWTLDQQVPPQNPPTQGGTTVTAEDLITGLNQPLGVEWLPNGTMLIAEKGGVIRTVSNGVLNSTPFIDISDIVNDRQDRGLIDIAVHPDFANNPYIYMAYTYDPPEVQNFTGLAGPDGGGNRAGRLVRVTADASNGYLTAVAGSEVILLGTNSTWNNFNGFVDSTNDFNEPPAGENPDGSYLQDFINSDSRSHTMGGLAFAQDGSLFVAIGDGASFNQVDVRADRVQDIDSLSGKILKIDPITGLGLSTNPFATSDLSENRSKVYQLGVRNPFRITTDSITGDLFIGDVGWGNWEEINSGGPGANFGWPFYEGGSGVSLVLNSYGNTPEGQAFFANNVTVDPSIYALNHAADGINAIVMGDAYRGSLYGSEYQGDVFFNDLGQGIVRHASLNAAGEVIDVQTFATGANVVVAINQGPDGALYYVDLDDGKVGRWLIV